MFMAMVIVWKGQRFPREDHMSQLSNTVVPHPGNENSRRCNSVSDITKPVSREANLLLLTMSGNSCRDHENKQ
jgi:hypothetical protein